jgi:hypothetical protein
MIGELFNFWFFDLIRWQWKKYIDFWLSNKRYIKCYFVVSMIWHPFIKIIEKLLKKHNIIYFSKGFNILTVSTNFSVDISHQMKLNKWRTFKDAK